MARDFKAKDMEPDQRSSKEIHGADDEDEVLISRIRNKDQQAFEILVERHSKRFFALAWRITSNDQDAEDVVQDAFVKLWTKPELYNPQKKAKFTTWFYRIVSNMAIDVMRKRKKTTNVESFDWIESEQGRSDEDMIEDQKHVLMETEIQTLPDKQKLALTLCFYEGLSNKEAAQVMDVSLKALESLLMRAKTKLKDGLKRQGVL